ncbi:MAG: preQ(1) synthase [Elusimicrobiota bacterium]
MKRKKRPTTEATPLGYTSTQARSGTRSPLPAIDTWQNQYRHYVIRIDIPEFTSICPKTGLPDFGTITVEYLPDKRCLELKSLKNYILAYRSMGVFYENAVNRILDDVAAATKPKWAVVTGAFTARGGMRSTITVRHPRRRQTSWKNAR